MSTLGIAICLAVVALAAADFSCNGEEDYKYPVPGDCRLYYVCSKGSVTPQQKSCSWFFHDFDPVKLQCEWCWKVDCSASPSPAPTAAPTTTLAPTTKPTTTKPPTTTTPAPVTTTVKPAPKPTPAPVTTVKPPPQPTSAPPTTTTLPPPTSPTTPKKPNGEQSLEHSYLMINRLKRI